MYDELVKRLRSATTLPAMNALCQEAADAMEELADRNVGQWIPVTERLPKKPEGYPKCEIRRTYYLVALKSGCVKTLGYEFDRDEWQITGSPVVAWMPLPKPPKEET